MSPIVKLCKLYSHHRLPPFWDPPSSSVSPLLSPTTDLNYLEILLPSFWISSFLPISRAARFLIKRHKWQSTLSKLRLGCLRFSFIPGIWARFWSSPPTWYFCEDRLTLETMMPFLQMCALLWMDLSLLRRTRGCKSLPDSSPEKIQECRKFGPCQNQLGFAISPRSQPSLAHFASSSPNTYLISASLLNASKPTAIAI